ncbi:MAG TPA: family 20 glycosylhydrolase [Bacteroidales bacterium]|nr:family 20 glycosylhydrolase [Bacteroidales bacterium]
MKRLIGIIVLSLIILPLADAERSFPVLGLCIAAPGHENVKDFEKFIREDLSPLGVNTLVLRVDWNYAYETHPELSNEDPLTKQDVRSLVRTCKELNIKIIPQINLLGHQSWHSKAEKLLEVYPQFDETPWVVMPEKYEWPNPDGLYCKSYCPLHPDIHKIIFDVVGELVDAFEAEAFHAGMDEVFYLGESKCPRCSGRDKAELFAGEVNAIRNFLATKNAKLWIWGDRLIDGKGTGYGMWEASMNNTYRAIDMIYKDVVICDWHYERPDLSAVWFAFKGFTVLTCPYRSPEVALKQLDNTETFIKSSIKTMKGRYAGILQTEWGSAEGFMSDFREIKKNGVAPEGKEKSGANTFYILTKKITAE